MITFCTRCKKTHEVDNYIPGYRYYCLPCQKSGDKTLDFHHKGRILDNDELDMVIAYLEKLKRSQNNE